MGGGFAAMGSLTLTQLSRGRVEFKAPRKYGGFFRKESEHRDFVSIGTAAGEEPPSICLLCCDSFIMKAIRGATLTDLPLELTSST